MAGEVVSAGLPGAVVVSRKVSNEASPTEGRPGRLSRSLLN